MENIENKPVRIIYFDYLRIIAMIAVMILHIAAQNISAVDVHSFDWTVFNIVDGSVRWGVPVFIMISGALFIPKKVTVKQIYTKYILRLFIAYCFWTLVYALVLPVLNTLIKSGVIGLDYNQKSDLINAVINGKYHMWFLPMIAGLYMCIPIYQKIVESKKLTSYFLIVAFILQFIVKTGLSLCTNLANGLIWLIAGYVQKAFSNMAVGMFLGYGFYFVLGYVLSTVEISKKWRRIIYAAGAAGWLITILPNQVLSLYKNRSITDFYGNLTINTLCVAVAIFVWARYHISSNPKKSESFVLLLSKCSFGAYLIHALIIDLLRDFGLTTLSFNPLLSIPLISVIVVTVSMICSFILNRIPILKKWIV